MTVFPAKVPVARYLPSAFGSIVKALQLGCGITLLVVTTSEEPFSLFAIIENE